MVNAIYENDIFTAYDGSAAPAVGQSNPVALTSHGGSVDNARTVTWETRFGTAPTAIQVDLEESNDNATWTQTDTSTAAAGEKRTVANVRARFLRIRVVSVTVGPGAAFTAEIMA